MSQLEALLGRKLPVEARASVPTLNDLPAALLEEARALARRSRPAAVLFLQYHVVRSVEAPDFCEEVLLGTADAATWGTRDVICVSDAGSTALLSFCVPDAMEALRPIEGDRWYRLAPPAAPSYFGVPGAPGVLVRAARYWWERPAGVESAVLSGPIERLSDADVPIAMRRWLASRIAWTAGDYLGRGAPSVNDLLAALGGSPADASPDALIATEALVRESRLPDEQPTLALGFRGPDDWYR
jgi:hypothetical protein